MAPASPSTATKETTGNSDTASTSYQPLPQGEQVAARCRVQPSDVWAAYGLGQLTCTNHETTPNAKATNCKENPWCIGGMGLKKLELKVEALSLVSRGGIYRRPKNQTETERARWEGAESAARETLLAKATAHLEELKNRFADIEVQPDRAVLRSARTICFLPSNLLRSIAHTQAVRLFKLSEKEYGVCKDLVHYEEQGRSVAGRSHRASRLFEKHMQEIASAFKPRSARFALCPHGRISLQSVISGELKLVTLEGAEQLLSDYNMWITVIDGGASRDHLRTGVDLCHTCVQLLEDRKLARTIYNEMSSRSCFSTRPPPLNSFYIRMASLVSFRTDAINELEREKHSVWKVANEGESDAESSEGEEPEVKRSRPDISNDRQEGVESAAGCRANSQPLVFNDGIVCAHGGLKPIDWMLAVSREEWKRLRRHFQKAAEVPTTLLICEACLHDREQPAASTNSIPALISGHHTNGRTANS